MGQTGLTTCVFLVYGRILSAEGMSSYEPSYEPFQNLEKMSLVRHKHKRIKPHVRSVLYYLPEEQKEQLHKWLRSPLTYPQVIKRLHDELGLKVSYTALSAYYRRFMSIDLLDERDKSLGIAVELNKIITKCPSNFNKTIVDLLARKTFDLLKDPDAHPKIVKIYLDLFYRMQEQQFKDRVIKIKERHIALKEKQQAKAAKENADSRLSAKEKAERVSEILKVLPSNRLPTNEQVRKACETTKSIQDERNSIAS